MVTEFFAGFFTSIGTMAFMYFVVSNIATVAVKESK